MNVSAWGHLWGAATMLFAQEPIQIRIAMALVAAFTALMVVEGLRASFIPRRTRRVPQSAPGPSQVTARPIPESPPQPDASTKVLASPPGDAAQHSYAPTGKLAQRNPKRDLSKPRAQHNMRPKIRRMVTASERDSMPG